VGLDTRPLWCHTRHMGTLFRDFVIVFGGICLGFSLVCLTVAVKVWLDASLECE
jgi:hypothetical protein